MVRQKGVIYATDICTCKRCGRVWRVSQSRLVKELCVDCRKFDNEQPTDADALPPGRWTTGVTRRFIPDAPTPPEPADEPEQPASHDANDRVFGLPIWETLRLNLEADRRWTTCACGCLLIVAGESCPACEHADAVDLAWCERAAVAASWAVTDYYKPREYALMEVAA